MKVLGGAEKTPLKSESFGLIAPALLIWGLMIAGVLGFIWVTGDLSFEGERYYMLPWCLLAGIIVLSPAAFLLYKGEFDPFHPLVFGVWSYIFPAFVFGGVILAMGWSDPYYLTYVENPRYNLPLSLGYVVIGFVGMVAGFALPIGKRLSEIFEARIPNWKWKTDEVWIPGILLLFAGIGVNIVGFLQGLIGFQRVDEIGIFDGLLVFLVIMLTEGSMLLWLAIFSTKEKTGIYYIVLFVLIALMPIRMALLGNRGSLLTMVVLIGAAFQYSGRRLTFKHTTILGIVLVFSVFFGVIYGTAFRNIKGSESRMNSGDYVGQVSKTIEYLTTKDTTVIISEGFVTLAERIDNLSALGVAVANYEKLAPYESNFGIENNILNDLYTSFIPRFVWADKPSTSDPRAYSDLYFNYSENSFAVTPFGDLLRNFGPIGVPLGMMIIGLYFRIIYEMFIKTKSPTIWKRVVYFVLLTVVSFEAFYATIFPMFIRSVFILVFSLFIANIVIKLVRSTQRNV